MHAFTHNQHIPNIQHLSTTHHIVTCKCTKYASKTFIHSVAAHTHTHTHAHTHTHTHLWWSVARCPSGVVSVELPQHRVAAPHFGHIKGRVKVRQLHCKPLSMVTGQGRHTTTLSGSEEVTRCRDEGEDHVQDLLYTVDKGLWVETSCI